MLAHRGVRYRAFVCLELCGVDSLPVYLAIDSLAGRCEFLPQALSTNGTSPVFHPTAWPPLPRHKVLLLQMQPSRQMAVPPGVAALPGVPCHLMTDRQIRLRDGINGSFLALRLLPSVPPGNVPATAHRHERDEADAWNL
jgi:hypothetical protein